MLNRISALRIASRRDVLLFVVASVLILAFSVAWALALVPVLFGGDQVWHKYFLTLVILLAAGIVGAIPFAVTGWGRTEHKPFASFMIRFGLALQIFGLLITPIGVYYASLTEISVPVAFASFTAVFLGLFVAGFGGNRVAPAQA